MKQNKGFTLIELMAVIAIVSILAVVALGAYQDYVVRSKVGEGMTFAAEAKTSISDYYYNRKAMPLTNAAAGLSEKDEYDKHKYISSLEVTRTPKEGTVNITFKIPGSTADGKQLLLKPTVDGQGYVSWICRPPAVNGIEPNHVPANCRG